MLIKYQINIVKMASDKFSKFGKIIGYNFIDTVVPYVLIIKCKTGNFILSANADCCSESWFEFPTELDSIINNVIINITTTNVIDLPYSGRQGYDINHIISITFQDKEEPYLFYLRNSSNGYYDGWLGIEEKMDG